MRTDFKLQVWQPTSKPARPQRKRTAFCKDGRLCSLPKAAQSLVLKAQVSDSARKRLPPRRLRLNGRLSVTRTPERITLWECPRGRVSHLCSVFISPEQSQTNTTDCQRPFDKSADVALQATNSHKVSPFKLKTCGEGTSFEHWDLVPRIRLNEDSCKPCCLSENPAGCRERFAEQGQQESGASERTRATHLYPHFCCDQKMSQKSSKARMLVGIIVKLDCWPFVWSEGHSGQQEIWRLLWSENVLSTSKNNQLAAKSSGDELANRHSDRWEANTDCTGCATVPARAKSKTKHKLVVLELAHSWNCLSLWSVS